jgi:hypothetical protein
MVAWQRLSAAFILGCSTALRARLPRVTLVLALHPADKGSVAAWARGVLVLGGVAVTVGGAGVCYVLIDRSLVLSALRHPTVMPAQRLLIHRARGLPEREPGTRFSGP